MSVLAIIMSPHIALYAATDGSVARCRCPLRFPFSSPEHLSLLWLHLDADTLKQVKNINEVQF